MAELSEMLARRNPRLPPAADGRLRQLLALAGVNTVTIERFDQDEALDDAGLCALLRSLSHVGPALGPPALEALLSEARALAHRHGGARWTRDLRLTWGAGRGTDAGLGAGSGPARH